MGMIFFSALKNKTKAYSPRCSIQSPAPDTHIGKVSSQGYFIMSCYKQTWTPRMQTKATEWSVHNSSCHILKCWIYFKILCFDLLYVPVFLSYPDMRSSYLKSFQLACETKRSGWLNMTQIIPNWNYSNMCFHFISQKLFCSNVDVLKDALSRIISRIGYLHAAIIF